MPSIVLALSPVMAAASAGMPVRQDAVSAIDVFALAEQARAEGRITDAIVFYDALSQDADPEVRAEARFRKGMTLADAKRFNEAAVTFRALLDEKPDAVRVRLELARVLAAAGNEGAARRELRQAEAAGLPREAAPMVEQFARALRSSRPFGGSIELALAPDTNINRATDARTLDTVIAPLTLSEDARAKSGVGAKLAGQGFARIDVVEGIALLPRLAGTANLYRQGDFNDVSGSALLGIEWRWGKDRISPSAGHTWRWYGNTPYAGTQTVSLDWLHPMGSRAQLLTSGSVSRVRYLRNHLQDGVIYDLNLGYERALDARTGIGVTLTGTRQTARDPGYATAGGGVSLLGWREIGGATAFGSLLVRRTEGDVRLFLFPERRKEWLVSARAGATLRQLTVHGFAPIVRVGYERNASTVGIYDYRRWVTEIGVTRAF